MTQSAALWRQLQQAGLVAGEMPIPHPDDQPPALFLRVLLGASGWLSAVFFCVFIAAFFVNFLAQASTMWIVGLALCGLSIGISRMAKIALFVEQFIFACSLAGQVFVVYGVWESSGSGPLAAATLLVLELILFAFMGIRSQRATAVFLACMALLWLLGQHAWLYALPVLSAAATWLWLNHLRFYKDAAYLQPATVGLTLALCTMIFIALLANSTELTWLRLAPSNWQTQVWVAAALSSLVCLLLAWQLIQRNVQQAQLRIIALLLSTGIALVNLKMLGLAPLCLLLCIAVALAHTRLIWLNLVCLVAYLLLYYYSLNNTLLYKSILLCASGAVLLILYGVLNRYANTLATEGNAHA